MGKIITDENEILHSVQVCECAACKTYRVNLANLKVEPETESDLREARRIAAIAESMNIIRTLNSRRIWFAVTFTENCIAFDLEGETLSNMCNLFPNCTGVIEQHSKGGTTISFNWSI